jgi:hypothetical protein
MKAISVGAAAAAMLLSQAAYAEAAAQAGFRTPEATPFTEEDIADFQVDAATAETMQEYRDAGYQVVALRADELEDGKAGLSSTTWIIIGVVALVVIVAAADGGGGSY